MTILQTSGRTAAAPSADHPRSLGWFGTTALAMGGSNQSLFLLGALLLAQGTAAVPLLAVGLVLAWAALPGWTELVLMFPKRVGGIAAACSEAFRPYSAVLANLTGVCYWWGWVPTCGLTALLSAEALHAWMLPQVPVPVMAVVIVIVFAAVNLAGVRWVARVASPIAVVSAALAFISSTAPMLAGTVDWHRALDFHLTAPFAGPFGEFTSAMAGLYLVGFAAPAFEAASCHVGETRAPERNVSRAMFASAGIASVYFVVLPVVWLGTVGEGALTGDLATVLGPTFAPLLGGAAKAAAVLFMVFNMFHGTLQPLAGAARTLAQLADDGLLPRVLGRRIAASDAPVVATCLTAVAAIAFLLAGDPTWLVAAANLTYLIGISLPSVAVWLLRRNMPGLRRPFRAPRWTLTAGLFAAGGWLCATLFGFEQYGLPTVLTGVALAYSGSLLYLARVLADRRAARLPLTVRSMHLKLTGAMLAVLVLDGAGYLLAIQHIQRGEPELVTLLEDVFVGVALLTISVGLVLPGTIAHASGEVMRAADSLARGALRELNSGLLALSQANLADARVQVPDSRVAVHTRDEIGAMAGSFNAMVDEVQRAGRSLDVAREQLRMHLDHLEELVQRRTADLAAANDDLVAAQQDRSLLLQRALVSLEQQRRSIAADLHDGPIQRLATVGMMLDRAELSRAHGRTPEAEQRVQDARAALSAEIDGLRRIMVGLRPPVLDESGGAAAIADHAGRLCELAGLALDLDVVELDLSEEVETALYRIVQEALANVVRHAAASRVALVIRAYDDRVELSVDDDGCGFDLDELPHMVRGGHFGLAGMRERCELVGARLEVRSQVGAGTRLRVTLPAAVREERARNR
ncbi:amino acid permease [Amnibacterium kyonggiense]